MQRGVLSNNVVDYLCKMSGFQAKSWPAVYVVGQRVMQQSTQNSTYCRWSSCIIPLSCAWHEIPMWQQVSLMNGQSWSVSGISVDGYTGLDHRVHMQSQTDQGDCPPPFPCTERDYTCTCHSQKRARVCCPVQRCSTRCFLSNRTSVLFLPLLIRNSSSIVCESHTFLEQVCSTSVVQQARMHVYWTWERPQPELRHAFLWIPLHANFG